METFYDLLEMYPSRPRKLLSRWHDARLAHQQAGESFVAAGRAAGSAEDAALIEADRWEIACYEAAFGPRLGVAL
jgi:hypothetical protein